MRVPAVSERTFEFKDGTSNKFWAISVSGDSHTTRYGKIGSKGQSTTKAFATPEKAQADADKLIAEKTGKGYTETTPSEGSAGASPSPTAGEGEAPAEPVKAKPAAKKGKAKAAPAPEPVEEPDTPAVPATPPAVPSVSHAIDLEPEDSLWVTYGERPPFAPATAGKLTPSQFLAALDDPEQFVEKRKVDWRHVFAWLDELMTTTIPRLSAAEREQARATLRPQVALAHWPTQDYDYLPPAFGLAALLGLHDETEAVVASWADGSASLKAASLLHFKHPARMVFGLESKERVLAHGRRLKLHLDRPEYVRGWLAHTGTDALDVIRDSVQATERKEDATKLLDELCRVKSPAAAPLMLELMLDSKAPAVARSWFLANPGSAAVGLATTAAGKGKLADAAREFFAELKAKGQTEAIRAAIAAHPEAATALQAILDHEEKTYPALDRAAMPADLSAAFDALPKMNWVPNWMSVSALPPILVNGSKLAEPDVRQLLSGFCAWKAESRPPVSVALKAHADPRSLDTFAWALFQAWNKAGFPSKEKWSFLACGWLGGDNTARQLTPLIREWPGQSQHQRAKTGLEVLRMIGTDIALTMLNGIAQKLKFAALKARARELMDLIADDRGMSRAELEDRIVPELDLDEKGERVFDYGPRQFRLVIGQDYKPRAKGPDDKVKDSLPAPNSKDDAEKAKLAKADWTAFTKVLKGVLELQRARLEQAMVTMRRWKVADFEAFLVKHPVMTHLTRRLVWGQYTTATAVASTFRVTDEGEYADAKDKPLKLDPALAVGIVHPMQLSEADRNAWGQVFGDYEIVPPFAQLGRPVHELEGKEATETELHRVDDAPVNSGKVWGFMEKRGWDRGSSSDHGVVTEFAKFYPAANVTAVVNIDPGIARGGLDMLSPEQTITGCYFLRGHYNPVAYATHQDTAKVPLGQVDPVALSETLGDMYKLTAKE